jgi:hypothetical protein
VNTAAPFDYSDVEWAKVEDSISGLNAACQLSVIREKLVGLARDFKEEVKRKKERARLREQHKKGEGRKWAKLAQLANKTRLELFPFLQKLKDRECRGNQLWPAEAEWKQQWQELTNLLIRLETQATKNAHKYDESAPRCYLDELAPRRQPMKVRSRYLVEVLQAWTDVGGKLSISRNKQGKVSGPLSRYFVAATRPVLGDLMPALETLPDIISQWRAEKARMDIFWEALAQKTGIGKAEQ